MRGGAKGVRENEKGEKEVELVGGGAEVELVGGGGGGDCCSRPKAQLTSMGIFASIQR